MKKLKFKVKGNRGLIGISKIRRNRSTVYLKHAFRGWLFGLIQIESHSSRLTKIRKHRSIIQGLICVNDFRFHENGTLDSKKDIHSLIRLSGINQPGKSDYTDCHLRPLHKYRKLILWKERWQVSIH